MVDIMISDFIKRMYKLIKIFVDNAKLDQFFAVTIYLDGEILIKPFKFTNAYV